MTANPTATATATRWPTVALLWCCGVLAGGQFAKVSVAFGALQGVYAISPAQLGLLLSTVGVVGLACGVVAGQWAPRLGYRRLLVAGLAGGAAVSALQALLPAFGVFWASRVVEGAAHLAIMVAAPTLLIHACAPGQRAAAMGLWATVVGLAFAVTAALERALGGLALAPLLAGHAGLMALAACAVRLWVADAPGSPAPLPGVLALHRQAYADRRSALPGLAFFFYAFPTIALITFVPQFAGQGSAGFHTALPLLATAGTLAAGWAARRWAGGLGLVRACFAAFALAAGALAVAAAAGEPTEALALLTLACAGLCGGAASTLIPQLNPAPAGQARASGVLVQLGNLGSVTGPPLFGWVAAQFGLAGVAALAAGAAVVALMGLLRLPQA